MSASRQKQNAKQDLRATETAVGVPGQPKPAPIQFYGGYQVYSESGVDLTLLRENLKRTVSERLEKNQRGVELAKEMDRSRLAKTQSQMPKESALMLQDTKIIQVLTDQGVEFVLIGGLAMRAHGSAHITEDVDVCYSRTKENIKRLADAVAPFHPYLRGAPAGLPFRFDVPTLQAGLNFTLTSDLGEVDFLGEVSGLGNYERVVAQSEELVLYERKVRVLSLDGLLIAKKAAGRRQDQSHILELEELKKMRDEGAKS